MKRYLALLLTLLLLLSACGKQEPADTQTGPCTHADKNDDAVCDKCKDNVVVFFDFYAVNDLHGKVADSDTHPGVDELTAYIKQARKDGQHVILLSTGDMWQGSSESNLTKGNLTTDWMNELGFVSMTLGNHEYDWGEEPIEANFHIAQFPFLAINVYDRDTDQLVDYCQSSVLVEKYGIQIGIIGAMGDCYSSIAADKSAGVYFKTGDALTQLVKDEATRLREKGADFIVYSIHDGYGKSSSGEPVYVTGNMLADYYDTDLSDGYVDLVFEAHTHQRYVLRDEHGVYHLQGGGDNKGITHAKVRINYGNNTAKVMEADLIPTGTYARLEGDGIVDELLAKYADQISLADRLLGTNSTQRNRDELRQVVADLYYEYGMETWGDEYDIVLAGGFMSVRSPGSLATGNVTYGMVQSLFPFDNELVLCSISGRDLKNKFFETDNDNYFISYGDYGESVRQNIDPNGTYYVVTDTYSSTYAPNNMTEIVRYGEGFYARDMLAEYIATGAFE